MKPQLVLFTAAGILAARVHATACDGSCMSGGNSLAARGAKDVPVAVTGRHDSAVRAYSLSVGHDASKLALKRIDLGPLFAGAELVSTTIRNEAGPWGSPYGALFMVLDFTSPIDRIPVDISGGAVLGTFYYDVADGAHPGPTGLHIGQLEYGDPLVAAVYGDDLRREIYPDLVDGEINILSGVAVLRVSPDHGALQGGTEIVVEGSGFGAVSDTRVFLGAAKGEVLGASGETRLVVRTPPATAPGKVSVRVEGPSGSGELLDGFEYQPAPVVKEVDPPAGPGDMRVRVLGEGFAPESRAFIGSLELSEVAVLDRKTLEGRLGPCAQQASPGPYDVRVENLNGSATLEGGFDCAESFLRADCNHDTRVDISDAIGALGYLFLGEIEPACLKACDTNDDGELDISDPIVTLNYLFLGGRAPGQPFPLAGVDPTPDGLGCGG
jgi:hypothetical protein